MFVGAGLVPARSGRQAAQPIRPLSTLYARASVIRAHALNGQGRALPLQVCPGLNDEEETLLGFGDEVRLERAARAFNRFANRGAAEE